jgi:ATP-dependent helicase/nuclease subunit A
MTKPIQWTPQQKLAITRRGSDVLVTASAGTGKTAVLSNRCLSLLVDPARKTSLLNMLILTFTDAAAEEMRTRIRAQLTDKAQGDPAFTYLQREVLLLPCAQISTIHSFCKQLITDHFFVLGLDPGFRLIDADEQDLLKSEALEKTLEWAWQQQGLEPGLRSLFHKRSLSLRDGFPHQIVQLSDYLDGLVSRPQWYDRVLSLAQSAHTNRGEYARQQWQMINDILLRIQAKAKGIEALFTQSGAKGTSPVQALGQYAEQWLNWLDQCQYEQCVRFMQTFKKPRITKPKDCDEAQAKRIQGASKILVGQFSALNRLAVLHPDQSEQVARTALVQTETLVALVRQFDTCYTQMKQGLNCLDFSDLEHLALRLLVETDSTSAQFLEPTDTALRLRRQYEHLFVDEFQDVNPVQNTLMRALSRGDNLFVVGDVKQSIYAFRGAQPDLFLDRLAGAGTDTEKKDQPLRVDLNANFRSATPILQGVNHLFERLMTRDSVGLDYRQSGRFTVADTLEDASRGPLIELHLIDEQENAEADDGATGPERRQVTGRQYQAALVARRIQALVGTAEGCTALQIFDKSLDCCRDLTYGDIVVLMRSPARRVDDYIGILRLAGIPVSCPGASGFFEATEIRDMLNVLKVLDNPQRDIEFAAFLRGPLGDVTDTELAEIVLHARTSHTLGSFYDKVRAYVQTGPKPELGDKLTELLKRVDQWRQEARCGSLADLIWQILREGGLLAFVQALPAGAVRRANLLSFHDRAIQFEGFASSRGGVSLRRFVEFVEQLQEAGVNWSSAEPASQEQNAVRITSVHKSKGLEYPVVILAELNSSFSQKDVTNPVLVSAQYGLGLQVHDPQSGHRLDSLARQVIAEEKARVSLAEEMRILYVALTRARERLILMACHTTEDCCKVLDALDPQQETVECRDLRSWRKPIEWILAGWARQQELRQAIGLNSETSQVCTGLIDVTVHAQESLQVLSRFIESLSQRSSADAAPGTSDTSPFAAILAQFQETQDRAYPFAALTRLPAKRSVSQLAHQHEDREQVPYRSPGFDFSGDLGQNTSQRIVGTATHLILSSLPLAAPVTDALVEQEINTHLSAGAFTQGIAPRINRQSIRAFFDSPLGHMALDPGNRVFREWPFTVRLAPEQGAADTEPVDTQDHFVVQGIADMIIQTDAGLHIVDFKTDQIRTDQVDERTDYYKDQLHLYAKAVEKIMAWPIAGRWLYFLNLGCSVQV